jgi:hypothetical protein
MKRCTNHCSNEFRSSARVRLKSPNFTCQASSIKMCARFISWYRLYSSPSWHKAKLIKFDPCTVAPTFRQNGPGEPWRDLTLFQIFCKFTMNSGDSLQNPLKAIHNPRTDCTRSRSHSLLHCTPSPQQIQPNNYFPISFLPPVLLVTLRLSEQWIVDDQTIWSSSIQKSTFGDHDRTVLSSTFAEYRPLSAPRFPR